jgi:hypothetical protein
MNKRAKVSLKNINVNRLDSSSGIFAGKNAQNLWDSDSKDTHGFGSYHGDKNSFEKNVFSVKKPTSY